MSPAGRDTNAGTKSAPFQTIQKAKEAVCAINATMKGDITVYLRRGVSPLDKTLEFSERDSGKNGGSVIYTSYPGERPEISGGRKITGWHASVNGLWIASVPEDAKEFHQLFVNEKRLDRAYLPAAPGAYFHIADTAPPSKPNNRNGDDRFVYTSGNLDPSWHNLSDVEVCAYHTWNMSRLKIASLDDTSHTVTFTGPTSYVQFTKGNRYRVENVFEALPQEPGAWYLDRQAGQVYYHPQTGEEIANFAPIASHLQQLVLLKGDSDKKQWVSHITLKGLSFRHTDWPLPAGGYSCVQAEVDLSAAIVGSGARDCRIENCEVTPAGTYAVEWGRACQRNQILSCAFHDLGAGGIKIGEGTIQTDADDIARDNVVQNCRIFDGGQVHPAAVGVWIGQSPGNQILHNDIHDLYYTGISAGWTWGYGEALAQGTQISYNRIYNIGRGLLSDMGGIYTLGNHQGSALTHNVIHDVVSFDYGGWGIYPDEGTTGLLVRDNLVYGCKSAGLHQHYGKDNVIENNIFALNTEAQLARTRAEDHRSFAFDHNIVYWPHGDLFWGNWTGGNEKITMDNNLYYKADSKPITFDGKAFAEWQKSGQDVHSQIADPLFVSADTHEFHLKAGSPALTLGFQPFDSQEAGAK